MAAFAKVVSYSVSDAVGNVVAGAGLNEAVNITVTGSATAVQAATVLGAGNSGATSMATIEATAGEIQALIFGVNDVVTNVIVSGSFANETINLSHIPDATNITFNGRAGSETVILPEGGSTGVTFGNLNLTGGGGEDTFVIHGGGAGNPRNLTALDLVDGGSYAVATSDVNATTDTITITTHGFVTGDEIQYISNGLAITGLTTGLVYYAIRTDANNFQLATSYATAIAGTAIDITGSGNLFQTFSGMDIIQTAGDVDLSLATIAGIEVITAQQGSPSVVVLSAAQLASLVRFTGDGTTDLTIGDSTGRINVTLGVNVSGIDTLNVGNNVTVTGSLAQFALLTTLNTDSATPGSTDQGEVNFTMTVAANNSFTGTLPGGTATKIITLTDTAGSTHIDAIDGITGYTLHGSGANIFDVDTNELGVNVKGGALVDTINIAGLAVTGTYALGDGTDVIVATTGANIAGVNGGAATSAETLDLTGAITMTVAQHNAFTTVTAGGGSDAITLSTAGTAIADAEVEKYVLAGAGANTITLTDAAQGVTTAVDASNQTVEGGALTSLTGAFVGNTTATNILNITTTATNISSATGLTAVGNWDEINLADSVNATMTNAQNALITTATNTNIVTLSDAGAATGAALVESYVLAAGTNTFTMGADDQNIKASGGVLQIDVLTINALDFKLGTIDETAVTAITLDMTNSISADLLNLDGASLAAIDTLVLTALQAHNVSDWASIDWDGTGTSNIADFLGGLDILGSAGVQVLVGSAGNDVIATGTGADTVDLSSGGADTVVFDRVIETMDVSITGFTVGNVTGADILDFSALALGHGVTGDAVVFNHYTSALASASDTVIAFDTLQLDTAANVATAVQLATGGLGEGSQMIFLIANTADTAIGVWSWQDSVTFDSGRIDAAELTKIGQLQVTGALATLSSMDTANFIA